MIADRFSGSQATVLIQVYENGRNLQQRVGRGKESAGLDVDYDRQESAEALGDTRGLLLGVLVLTFSLTHESSSASVAGSLSFMRSRVSLTPNPVTSVGTWASPPLC